MHEAILAYNFQRAKNNGAGQTARIYVVYQLYVFLMRLKKRSLLGLKYFSSFVLVL